MTINGLPMLNSQHIIDALHVLPVQEHPDYLKQVASRLSTDENEALVRDLADYLLRDSGEAERLEEGVLSAFGRPRFAEVIRQPQPLWSRVIH